MAVHGPGIGQRARSSTPDDWDTTGPSRAGRRMPSCKIRPEGGRRVAGSSSTAPNTTSGPFLGTKGRNAQCSPGHFTDLGEGGTMPAAKDHFRTARERTASPHPPGHGPDPARTRRVGEHLGVEPPRQDGGGHPPTTSAASKPVSSAGQPRCIEKPSGRSWAPPPMTHSGSSTRAPATRR